MGEPLIMSHNIVVQTMSSSCLLKSFSTNMRTVFNRFLYPLTCFRSVGAGSCALSFPVNVSNSRLSARGRHHGIALSRDESFIKILGKPFPPSPL